MFDILVFDIDKTNGFEGGDLVIGGHCGHGFTDVKDLFEGHDPPVFQSTGAEPDIWIITTGDDTTHPGQSLCRCGVDAHNLGVAAGAGHDLAHEHAGQVDVAGVGGPAGYLIHRIHTDGIFTDRTKFSHCYSSDFWLVALTATNTDSMTLVYPVQRHRFPPSACLMFSSDGSSPLSRNPTVERMIPGVQ